MVITGSSLWAWLMVLMVLLDVAVAVIVVLWGWMDVWCVCVCVKSEVRVKVWSEKCSCALSCLVVCFLDLQNCMLMFVLLFDGWWIEKRRCDGWWWAAGRNENLPYYNRETGRSKTLISDSDSLLSEVPIEIISSRWIPKHAGNKIRKVPATKWIYLKNSRFAKTLAYLNSKWLQMNSHWRWEYPLTNWE